MPNRPPPPGFPFAAVVFAGLFLLAPLPIYVFDGWVPLARICLLAGVCIAVAATEGAAGPVGSITLLLVAHAAAYAALLLVAARLARRFLRRLPPRVAVGLLVAALIAAAGLAVLLEPYVTPFGLRPRGNLLEVLS